MMVEGQIGELLVHASGRCQMQIGDILMDLNDGLEHSFRQTLVLVDIEGERACELGNVQESVVVTPNIEQILRVTKENKSTAATTTTAGR